jgi:hypothetical protein
MARITTVNLENARGIRRLFLSVIGRRQGGFISGITQVLVADIRLGLPLAILYRYLNLRRDSPLSRLQHEMIATVVNGLIGDEHLSPDFAATWPTYELNAKTRALLTYATRLTESPSMLGDSDIEALRLVGWDDAAIYQATALIGFFNFTGRMEAASGLPLDQVPAGVQLPESKPDRRS